VRVADIELNHWRSGTASRADQSAREAGASRITNSSPLRGAPE
jgi:hypothetical protein